jgi:hypothetical protein
MGQNGKLAILKQLAAQAIDGEEVQCSMFKAYLETSDIDDEEATKVLKEVYQSIKPDMLLNNIAFYMNQNRSEELNKWLDFTRRFVESVKKEPEKLNANARYWIDSIKIFKSPMERLIQANIIDQVNRELF